MGQICNCCGDKLKNSNHYEVRIARDHDKEERVDELQNDKEKKDEDESRKAEEHDKMIEELKNALRKLTSQELKEEEEKLREEIAQLRAELENPDKEDEEKQSKHASLEYLAVEPQRHNKISGDHLLTGASVTHQSNYSVLMIDQSYRDRKPGDKLLIRLGSVD